MLRDFFKELIGNKANVFMLIGISYLVTDQVFLRNRVSVLEDNLTECDSAYKKFLFENTRIAITEKNNTKTLKTHTQNTYFIKPKEYYLE